MAFQGSVINRVMESGKQRTPEVGDGATVTMWSDRHACTIVNVRLKGGEVFEIDIQRDKATRTDSYGMSDCQSYSYEADTTAPLETWRQDRSGKWRRTYLNENGRRVLAPKGGDGLIIGRRDEHYDYSH